jgi:hypothetical protein
MRVTQQQSFTPLELKRSPATFPLDHELDCDPLLSPYKNRVAGLVRSIQADLVHITAPGYIGILGFGCRIPRGFRWLLPRMPTCTSTPPAGTPCAPASASMVLARLPLAPNETMADLLQERSGKPARLMEHGVDTEASS